MGNSSGKSKEDSDNGSSSYHSSDKESEDGAVLDSPPQNAHQSYLAAPEHVPVIDRESIEKHYYAVMKPLRLRTHEFVVKNSEWKVPYTYSKQCEAINVHSTSLSTRMKRLNREISALSEDLPLHLDSSVFVCVDENRNDVVKALITGTPDSPYAHGLFEFDIFFPEQYPHKPPSVTFVTTGNGKVRFNPNLYATGYVCLSIINTWTGKAEEQWNPYLSLHKILLAIQAFVFVKHPFFNEPGFNKMASGNWGKRCSRRYNARVRHATLYHALLQQLRYPSECFKDVIIEHCRAKKDLILRTSRAWLQESSKTAVSRGTGNGNDGNREEGGELEDGFDNEDGESSVPPQKTGLASSFGISKFSSLGDLASGVVPMGGIAVEGMQATVAELEQELMKLGPVDKRTKE